MPFLTIFPQNQRVIYFDIHYTHDIHYLEGQYYLYAYKGTYIYMEKMFTWYSGIFFELSGLKDGHISCMPPKFHQNEKKQCYIVQFNFITGIYNLIYFLHFKGAGFSLGIFRWGGAFLPKMGKIAQKCMILAKFALFWHFRWGGAVGGGRPHFF